MTNAREKLKALVKELKDLASEQATEALEIASRAARIEQLNTIIDDDQAEKLVRDLQKEGVAQFIDYTSQGGDA